MKIPKVDRYKTISLKTTDNDVARECAFDHDADIRFRLKHDVAEFNHPFREVGREYLLTHEARAKRGEISVGTEFLGARDAEIEPFYPQAGNGEGNIGKAANHPYRPSRRDIRRKGRFSTLELSDSRVRNRRPACHR